MSKQTADKWLEIAIKEIRNKIQKLKIGSTGDLYSSISGSIQELSGGDSYKAEILYNYYGIFPDMGVGKGQEMGDQAVNKLAGGGRKKKPWTKEIAHQAHRFGELMGKEFANKGAKAVGDSLLTKVEMET